MPQVSVVIPTYNRADFLTEAVDSVLNQTWKDFELIVVDDGSTDASGEVLKRYAGRLKYYYKQNEGPSSARNFGVSKARGAWVAFLDSDDIWEPNKLDVQIGFLNTHPDVNMICCGSYSLGSSRRRRSAISGDLWGDLFLTLFQRSFVNTSSVLLTQACFHDVGPFDVTIRTAEDYDLWLRVARRYPIAYLRAPLVGIRKHRDELSKDKLDLRKNAIRVIQNHFDPKRVPERVYRKRMADLSVYLGRGYLKIGDVTAARASFRQAIGLMPFRFRSIRYFLRTFLPISVERVGLKEP